MTEDEIEYKINEVMTEEIAAEVMTDILNFLFGDGSNEMSSDDKLKCICDAISSRNLGPKSRVFR